MEKIDCTPTWSGILPALLLVLEAGNKEGKEVAVQELKNMAKAADLYNQQVNPKNNESEQSEGAQD